MLRRVDRRASSLIAECPIDRCGALWTCDHDMIRCRSGSRATSGRSILVATPRRIARLARSVRAIYCPLVRGRSPTRLPRPHRQPPTCRGVAQAGSAPGLGPGGRRFESCLPDHDSVSVDIRGFRLFRSRTVSIGVAFTFRRHRCIGMTDATRNRISRSSACVFSPSRRDTGRYDRPLKPTLALPRAKTRRFVHALHRGAVRYRADRPRHGPAWR